MSGPPDFGGLFLAMFGPVFLVLGVLGVACVGMIFWLLYKLLTIYLAGFA